ncbi:MAG: GTP-binding protein, partial [Leptolinea sp.]
MNLHLVGGFLGSGKTTAIIGAAKLLLARGQRVGVITNDQGKYLVDTAFVRLAGVPTVEVTGGCFCCNYDDLDEHLDRLVSEVRPDVIFAESVGSCADIIATVVKPLLALRPGGEAPASYSVFVDSRLLQIRLAGMSMPFSESVMYIFDKQIEEAGLLILNKADLLDEHEKTDLFAQGCAAYPDKALRLQDSCDVREIEEWLELITSGRLPLPKQSLQIDYDRYAAGEAELAWLNEEFLIVLPPA